MKRKQPKYFCKVRDLECELKEGVISCELIIWLEDESGNSNYKIESQENLLKAFNNGDKKFKTKKIDVSNFDLNKGLSLPIRAIEVYVDIKQGMLYLTEDDIWEKWEQELFELALINEEYSKKLSSYNKYRNELFISREIAANSAGLKYPIFEVNK